MRKLQGRSPTMPNKKIAQRTRLFRSIHRWVSIPLLVFMFLIGTTGLLLGWKKQSALLPPTNSGTTQAPTAWISVAQVMEVAEKYAADELQIEAVIDRIDVRPGHGVAKVLFNDVFWEVQVDLSTGQVLSANQRTSDIIEKIHDGSIVDWAGNWGSDNFKLTYTTLVSLGLMVLSLSGFYLWYNPKRIKNNKLQSQ
ncbi:MAG: PepSY domain-containing protein [Flavobacteriaceae bacterium]|nr:PepSY domain-containing protein [Flavobacteriaceae bacterium]